MLHLRRAALTLMAVILTAGVAFGCGGDTSTPGTTTTTNTSGTSTTPAPVTLEQPAIWPAADVTFTTPEAAAADFVANVLQVPVNLGPFQQGDSRSGEIELRFSGEGSSGPAVVRSVLLLRQLGPNNGWFVIGAANDNASITVPDAGATVPAAPLTVKGRARGFEAAVVVTAFVAGDATQEFDRKLTMGGSMETPEPYRVSLDLSGATAGQTVVLLVRGGVGLETDPGEVGAIPVVIGG